MPTFISGRFELTHLIPKGTRDACAPRPGYVWLNVTLQNSLIEYNLITGDILKQLTNSNK